MKVEFRHHHQPGGVNLHALIRASTFLDRSRNRQGFAFVFRRSRNCRSVIVIRVIVGLAPVSFLRLRERREMDVRRRDLLRIEGQRTGWTEEGSTHIGRAA